MPEGLIAVCGDRQQPELKRVLIDDAFFDGVGGLFQDQEADFRLDCEEIPFSGTWRADADEIMTLPLPPSGQVLGALLADVSESSLDTVSARNFADENIRGLAIAPGSGNVLVQKYYGSQTLRPGRFLIPGVDGVSFRRTDDSALTFDRSLACIVEDGLLKFKSLTALGRVIDTTDIFRDATAEEVLDFAQHPLIDTANPDEFVLSTNQVVRRLIHAIQSSGGLVNQTIQSLQQAASQTSFKLNVVNGRVRMPSTNNEIKLLLHFLNDDLFKGALSGVNYVTNSKKRQ